MARSHRKVDDVRTRPFLVVAAVAVALIPAAQACHPALVPHRSHGVVVANDGPVPASVEFGVCEGPVTVRVTTGLGDDSTTDVFNATLTIDHPADVACLYGGCHDGPPTATFHLRNASIGVDLDGRVGNGLHVLAVHQVSGSYRDRPAVFGALVG